jgi:hypothetical protein
MNGAIIPLPLNTFTVFTGATLPLLLTLWLAIYKGFFFAKCCIGLCALQGCAGPHIGFYICLTLTQIKGNDMVGKVIHQPLTAEVQIQYWANLCGISGGTRGSGSVFFFSWFFTCPLPVLFHKCSILIQSSTTDVTLSEKLSLSLNDTNVKQSMQVAIISCKIPQYQIS